VVTQLQNAPTGWAAFRAFRQTPGPVFRRRHGNQTHGRYSKAGIAGMRQMRLFCRILRSGVGQPVPGFIRRIPPGWAAYRAARDG
jgi:hypothetical protein